MSVIYDLKDENEAKEYLKNLSIEYRFQCYQEKNPEGCHRLGDFLESIRREFDKAAKVYETNCNDYKYGHSCFKFANYFIAGKGVERDVEKGLAYHLKGCGHGYMPSCHNAALLYSTSLSPGDNSSLKDLKKAVQFFSKACDQDLPNSCHRLAGLYLQGAPPDVPKDLEQAFQLSKKACHLGHCHACVNLSIMYRRGDGVTKDETLAEKYKKRAMEIQKSVTQRENTITFSE